MSSQNLQLIKIILKRVTNGDVFVGIVMIIFLLIFIVYLIYAIEYPRDSILMGERWKYKNDLEPDESYVKSTKFIAKIFLALCIAGIVIILLSLIIKG